MAYTTIDNGEEHFNTVTYTGTGSSRSITGLEFGPDWVWIKRRNGAYSHYLYDSTRGTGKQLYAEKLDAEATDNTEVTAFNSDGFSLGSGSGTNENTNTQVAWCWKANGGTTSSNTNGDVTSTVQANTTAGFSIVTWTSTGGNESVGHGLGVTPNWFITKNRSAGANWKVYHDKNTSAPQTDNLSLNKTDATQDDAAAWNDTAPTSTTFTVGTDAGSGGSNGNNMIAYCFSKIQGYSKFGSYTGNGNADGTFVYTGFKPAWLMVKKSVGNARAWVIHDNKRDIDNPTASRLDANVADAEQSSGHFDFLSNGFKCRSTEGATNQDTHTFVYMAFAEHPFVSSKGVPVTAR
jgi:hypothetical protein